MWIGVALGVLWIGGLLFSVAVLMGFRYQYLVIDVLWFLSMCGLACAVLRHRVFDFGFVIKRALVFSALSAFVVLALSLAEWAAHKLLHFEGVEKNLAIDAVVALVIILSFHRIQHWVNHRVNHTFFRHWEEAAERLRLFAEQAAHITTLAGLQAQFIGALDRFSGGTGAALYAFDDEAAIYRQVHGTLAAAPATIASTTRRRSRCAASPRPSTSVNPGARCPPRWPCR